MLKLSDVYAGYGGGDVLQGVELDVPEGSVCCIVGPNGAGKSTVLRAVSGLLQPRKGDVQLEGKSLCGLHPAQILALGVSQVPQSNALFPGLTVKENVLMGAYIQRRDRKLLAKRYDSGRGAVPGDPGARGDRAGNLSGGQRRMVEFGRSLMLEPKLVLLESRRWARPQGAQARLGLDQGDGRRGKTVLLVEQNVRFGLRLAKQGVVMESGRVLLTGEAEAVLKNPEMSALYFGGTVEQAKGQKIAPVSRA